MQDEAPMYVNIITNDLQKQEFKEKFFNCFHKTMQKASAVVMIVRTRFAEKRRHTDIITDFCHKFMAFGDL